MLPGLLNRPIQKLEERLNTGLTELDSRVDDIAKKVIDQFEKKAVKAFTPESKKESSEQEGGALHGDVISIKTKKKGKKSTASRAKKTTSKGAKVATMMKLPPMESQSYRDLIMSKLLKGSGLMTHSLSTE